jgi:uncharacterized membrane protein YdjX (TVP38/TMEM64 family)
MINVPTPANARARAARRVQLAATLGPLLLFGAAVLLSGELRAALGRGIGVLLRGDLDAVHDYILGFGAWAPVMSVGLMVLQGIVAPIPAFVLTIANGLAFGALWGGVLSVVGRTLAAAVCFGIARALGRDVVESLVGRRQLEWSDRWFERWGTQAVLLARLAPFVSLDLVSYASGLTGLRLRQFLIATVLGDLPAIALYSWVGGRAPQYTGYLLLVNGLVFAGVLVVGIVRSRRRG